MVSNNLIRYQFRQVISAKDPESKQKEINKLKLLLDEKYPDIKKMDYGIGSKQHDAFDFIGPLSESLYDNQPLAIDNSLFSSFGIPILQPQTNSGKLSDLINTNHLKVNNSSEIVLSVGRNDDKGKREYKIELDKIKLKKQGVNQEFEATAFIVHIGKTMNSGHYVAYVKENDNNWYEYNDNKKTKISGNQLEERKKEAYIIKYSEVGTKLPDPQSGAVNLGNTCWSNASCAFLGSFTSFEKYKDVKLNDKEKKMLEVHDLKEEIKGKKKEYEKLVSKTVAPTENEDKYKIAIKKSKEEYDVEENYAQELANELRYLASEIRKNVYKDVYKDLQLLLNITDSLKLTESFLEKDISRLNLDEGKIKKYCELLASSIDKTANEVENHFKNNSSISDSDLEEYFKEKVIINATEFITKSNLLNEDKALFDNDIKFKNNSAPNNSSQVEIKKTTDNKKNLLKEIKSDLELKNTNQPEIASKSNLLNKLEKLEAQDTGKYTKNIEKLNDKIENTASDNPVIKKKYNEDFKNDLEKTLKHLSNLSQKNSKLQLSNDIENYYPKYRLGKTIEWEKKSSDITKDRKLEEKAAPRQEYLKSEDLTIKLMGFEEAVAEELRVLEEKRGKSKDYKTYYPEYGYEVEFKRKLEILAKLLSSSEGKQGFVTSFLIQETYPSGNIIRCKDGAQEFEYYYSDWGRRGFPNIRDGISKSIIIDGKRQNSFKINLDQIDDEISFVKHNKFPNKTISGDENVIINETKVEKALENKKNQMTIVNSILHLLEDFLSKKADKAISPKIKEIGRFIQKNYAELWKEYKLADFDLSDDIKQKKDVVKTKKLEEKPTTLPRLRSPEVQKTIQHLASIGLDENGNKIR